MAVVVIVGAISLLIWLGILLHPARPWDFRPVGEDKPFPPEPSAWPSVCALVPARNESETLPRTLPALLAQDYPGELSVIVIDDRSQDGTAGVARQVAAHAGVERRLTVIAGEPLPVGWVGKVWALAQGAARCGLLVADGADRRQDGPGADRGKPDYLFLTDADIRHAPGSLRRLVAESEEGHLALNSRMARLRCVSAPEHLLIPPFVFFFNLLYPMRRVNDQNSSVAAAAGGCVLLASSALERIGGFASIKDRVIDDVSLARQIKGLDEPIRLALSRHEVQSLRVYEALDAVWTMVRRTAFTELRYSWLRLAGTIFGLFLMFLVPPAYLISGIGIMIANVVGEGAVSAAWGGMLGALGLLVWALMAFVYRPAVRFFALPMRWSWTLPLAGALYGAMTIDSALRYLSRRQLFWRDAVASEQ